MANARPTPTSWPIQFGQRDAKVIETALAASSHLIKFVETGITGSALAGVQVGDICIQIKVSDSTAHWAAATDADEVPQTLASGDLVIVLRDSSVI